VIFASLRKAITILLSLLILSSVLLFMAFSSMLNIHRFGVNVLGYVSFQDTLFLDADDFKHLQWENKKEFSYRGRMFDVQSIKKEQHEIIIVGHFDEKEDRIKQYLSQLFNPSRNDSCMSPHQWSSDYHWMFEQPNVISFALSTSTHLFQQPIGPPLSGHLDPCFMPPER
jgi:hypothetical protein